MDASDLVLRLRAAGCVFAEDEAELLQRAAGSGDQLEEYVRRRESGTPLEQVIGWAEFAGLRVVVQPGVFVPRSRSELLVRRAVALAHPGSVVLDICCGSGALGAAVASQVPGIDLYAVDVEPAALECARANLASYGGRVFEGDLYDPLPRSLRGEVNIILANAPYVPSDEVRLMPREARLHEPLVTLDGGSDGLDIQRRVIRDAPGWLSAGGWLLVETSEAQAPVTLALFEAAGLVSHVIHAEEIGATAVLGTRV